VVRLWLSGAGRADAKCKRPLSEGDDSGSGCTLLMIAAGYGHAQLVELLLKCGAVVDLQNGAGWTALMSAVYRGRSAIVLRLLRAGADMTLRTPGGTALQRAKEGGHTECIEAFRQHLREVTGSGERAAVEAGSTGDDAAAASAAPPSDGVEGDSVEGDSGVDAVPDEVLDATWEGDEAAVLAWLDCGVAVRPTIRTVKASPR